MRKQEIVRMRIENKCEWEESDVSSDRRTHACILITGSSRCRKEALAHSCIISLKTIKSAVAKTISHYIPRLA